MNTIDSKPTISFGIAFKKYKAPSGNYTHDMLTLTEELDMYKKLDKRLKTNKFVKTEKGIKSRAMTLENDNYLPHSIAMRYEDKSGHYFIDYNKINLRGVGDTFLKIRAKFEEIFNK